MFKVSKCGGLFNSLIRFIAYNRGSSVMTEHEKLFFRIVSGDSDSNIWFHGMCSILRRLGFQEHIRGHHHIFTKEHSEEILNLQPTAAAKAKPYQVRQVRRVILKYRLGGLAEDGR
jgi:hypothetical protein